MKRILTTLLVVGVVAVASCAQSRTNRIYRPCPSSVLQARVEVQSDGDIDLVPCVGRSVLINGVATSNTLTVTGSSRTNFFPYFSTETNLENSPFYWDGTSYIWSNTTLDTDFKMMFRPGVGSGTDARFTVGVPTAAYLDLRATTGIAGIVAATSASLDAPTVIIGDSTNADTWLAVDSTNNMFSFANGDVDATFNVASVSRYQLMRTITAGGTTGNQTINQPAGTVNFAAGTGTAGITVTNSTVNTSSIVIAVARTNDTTCSVKNVVPAANSFVIRMTANCTAETSVGFLVLN